MKIKEYHIIDFFIGFFIIPFVLFICKVTLLLLASPESITDAMGIIYIAFVTGLYYVLSRKSSIYFDEKAKGSSAKTLGMAAFIIGFILITR